MPIGPSTELKLIFNFPTFRKNETSLELFNIVFENSFPKGFFWCNEKKSEFFQLALYSRYLQTTALKSWLFQNTIFQAHLLSKCSHFVNLNGWSSPSSKCHKVFIWIARSVEIFCKKWLWCQHQFNYMLIKMVYLFFSGRKRQQMRQTGQSRPMEKCKTTT